MGGKRDPLLQRRMTYVRLHLDILFGRGSRAGDPEKKSKKLPLQITSVTGKCMLGSVSAQLPVRKTSSSLDPTKLLVSKKHSESQGDYNAAAAATTETTPTVASGEIDVETDTAANEQAEAEQTAEELEKLPRNYVAVLGGPCASNRENKLLDVKRIQLVVVLVVDIFVTSLLLYRYKMLLDEDRFVVALRMTDASVQAALSLAICVWGLVAVALNRTLPLIAFRCFANLHFFLFFFRVPYLLYSVRYVFDIIAVALATTLATRMGPSYFITSGASDPILNADTSLQVAGNGDDDDNDDDDDDDDNQSQGNAVVTDVETAGSGR